VYEACYVTSPLIDDGGEIFVIRDPTQHRLGPVDEHMMTRIEEGEMSDRLSRALLDDHQTNLGRSVTEQTLPLPADTHIRTNRRGDSEVE
jgi:hypothetical protein